MPAVFSPALSLKAFASTAASSIAIPAPWAANGSIACAASPSSAIAPSLQSPISGTVNSAHRRHSSTAPISIRAVAGQRVRERRLDFVGLARRAPARPVPRPRHDGDDVDPPRARDRIGDEMRFRSHPELHARARYIRAAAPSHRACRARRSGRRIAAAPPGTNDAAPTTRCRRRRSAPPPVPVAAHCRGAARPSVPWRAR